MLNQDSNVHSFVAVMSHRVSFVAIALSGLCFGLTVSCGWNVHSGTCGNGKLDPGESCDQGYNNVEVGSGEPGDCNRDCDMVQSLCGNGELDEGEGCDEGADGGKWCTVKCGLIPGCGNGVVEENEKCDEAVDNREASEAKKGDCMKGVCHIAKCGDGILSVDEECDDGNNEDTDACTAVCESAACGDGVVQLEEECDDGNQSDLDACLMSCTLASCGDGIVRTGIEECDDGDEDDLDACLSNCVMAGCGDGFVWSSVEECDDAEDNGDGAECSLTCEVRDCGNMVVDFGEECDAGSDNGDDKECTSKCLINVCGDGGEGPSEECDDGNDIDDDACSNLCQRPRVIFITNVPSNGNLGGLDKADAKCQMMADMKQPGKYMAWLSGLTTSAAERLAGQGFTGYYKRPDGAVVAKGWDGLLEGKIQKPILVNQNGVLLEGEEGYYVWTNTSGSGALLSNSCVDWSGAVLGGGVGLARDGVVDSRWTVAKTQKNMDVLVDCWKTARLYCVQTSQTYP